MQETFDSDYEGLPFYKDVTERLTQFMTTFAGPNGENLLEYVVSN
jgi:hypothetical protein